MTEDCRQNCQVGLERGHPEMVDKFQDIFNWLYTYFFLHSIPDPCFQVTILTQPPAIPEFVRLLYVEKVKKSMAQIS